jgi:hypothetical protein
MKAIGLLGKVCPSAGVVATPRVAAGSSIERVKRAIDVLCMRELSSIQIRHCGHPIVASFAPDPNTLPLIAEEKES